MDDMFGDSWGFTPSSKMEDSERFKNCETIFIECIDCENKIPFNGVSLMVDVVSNGLTCSCGSNYFGRKSELECFCLLSNKITQNLRNNIKKYYDCWLICDDRMCGNRTKQQSVRGAVCVAENCHGQMIQEYTEKDLHTQLIYIETLVDIPRYEQKKKSANMTAIQNNEPQSK